MIPILYDENETTFESGGIGYLSDCTSCTVTEERNGIFECEFTYPCDGPLFHQIRERRIVLASYDDTKTAQPFDIYSRSETIEGMVTFYAHHISYRLSDSVVMPFTASTCKEAFEKVKTNLVSNNDFTFSTTISKNGNYTLKVPSICRDMLGGEEESILNVFGGEFKFDFFNVSLLANRGSLNPITEIRYGKNLISYSHDIDINDSYNAIVPYWFQEGGEGQPDILVNLPEKYIAYTSGINFFEVIPLDMSGEFENQPTVNELRQAARIKLNESQAWKLSETYEIDFAALWQTEEYKEFAPLQRVKLCDLVLVYFPQYGLQAVAEKVVKTVYNTLLERYESLTLGQLPDTFNGIINAGQ